MSSTMTAPATFGDIHRFEIAAAGLGRYEILVGVPPGYEQSETRYPLIYVTDGQLLFWSTLGAVKLLTLGVLPPAIVVAVGYPADEGTAGWYARRNFDFTPGPWEMSDDLGVMLRASLAALEAADGRPGPIMRAGGAERFLGFLRDELDPAVRESTATTAANRRWSVFRPAVVSCCTRSSAARLLSTNTSRSVRRPVSPTECYSRWQRPI